MADTDSRSGARYASAEIARYAERVHVPHDDALQQAFDAPAREGLPAIQLAPSEAKLLGLLVRLAGARKVVEVGTLAGYSALHLARALEQGGRLWSLEIDPHHAEIARANLARAGLQQRAEVRVGAALELLGDLRVEAPFDAIFIDADKENYLSYGRWAFDALRSGGLLVADNAYFFGRLLDESDVAGNMRRFHEEVAARFDSVCAPTPDGLLIALKP